MKKCMYDFIATPLSDPWGASFDRLQQYGICEAIDLTKIYE